MYMKLFFSLSHHYAKAARHSPPLCGFYPIRRRFTSLTPPAICSFSHLDRTVTLEIRGVSNTSKTQRNNGKHEDFRVAIHDSLSPSLGCDTLFLGLGKMELEIIDRYVEIKNRRKDPNQCPDFKRVKHILKRYRHYIDIVMRATELGNSVVGIGRSKYSEAASFGESASRNKLEVLRLLSLYLRQGNVLKGDKNLHEFKVVAPSIYNAVVSENAFYAFCRLHQHVYDVCRDQLYKKRNVKLMVIVDEWVLKELLSQLNNKLVRMMADGSPPMIEAMEALDNRSRHGWSRFLLQFVIAPMFALCCVISYQLYSYNNHEVANNATYDSNRGGQALRLNLGIDQGASLKKLV